MMYLKYRATYLIAAVAVAGVVASGCETRTVTPTPQHEWTATVVGVDPFAHLVGEGSATWVEGTFSFTTTMHLSGDAPGAIRPWHVHHGSCGTGGGIVGDDADYPRLVVGADGTASVTTTVPQALDLTADYHVNVHLSEAEMETIIACGELIITVEPQASLR